MLEADEHADLDHHEDVAKPKFTFTECIIAITLSLVLVTMLAVFLVVRIEDVVEAGVPDQFLGLILLPLVEKAAEHLTAIDEAWDGQIVGKHNHKHEKSLTFIELCSLSLYWPLDTDRALQRPPSCCGGLGSRQRHGPQLRDFHGRASCAGHRCGWKFPPRWREQLFGGQPTRGMSTRLNCNIVR